MQQSYGKKINQIELTHINQNIVQQIHNILNDQDLLIKKTQLKRENMMNFLLFSSMPKKMSRNMMMKYMMIVIFIDKCYVLLYQLKVLIK